MDEIDDLAGWCAYNPGMRTYLLTGDTASNQALSMYPTLTAKFNSMRTMAYIQRFLLIIASGRQMMFGTAATNAVTLTRIYCSAFPVTIRPIPDGTAFSATRWP